jgi:5-formyltetrahydrofolate cyclo-ligase
LLASAKIMVKNNIRKSLLEQGQLLSDKFIIDANNEIQSTAINKINLKDSLNNLLYFPFRKEVTLEVLTEELKKYSQNIYMPRIISETKIKFNLLDSKSLIHKNKYGIHEIINENYLDPVFFNTMFIPFVGVDINGYRLGYGGGYFDRALEKITKSNDKPLLVGLGYNYQIIDEGFGEKHDIKYDIVITETDILSFS